ncbi:hypothetical protein BASA50_010425 [Batrachochytrium salamandrivorans]|uniref:BZIP domain-containing protein n=1 Tax=Batrachochytrium salamandrivorans TaxID=1357716 RepID=A0ABQ8F1N5_9FUNG|nr:hypothetical protein BASA50_010425 [Batrachochytrium salamandrivorans]
MKLISFLAIPLLSIAVSAQPPHNPDTQNTNPFPDDDIQEMDQSQNDAAQDIPYFLDSDFEMLESILGSVAQTMNQPQGVSAHDGVQSTSAATWNAQSPLGSTSQDMHQYSGSSSQSAQRYQGISAQDREQSTSAATWNAPNPLAATSQYMHQYPGSSSQSAQQLRSPLAATSQYMHQYPGSSSQSAQQPRGISAKNRKKYMRAAPQSDQRSGRRRFQVEKDRLAKAARLQDNILIVMNSHINSEKTYIIGVNGMIEAVGIKLQDTSLSSDKKPELQEKSRELTILANELDFRQSEKHQSRIETKTKRRNANAALRVFQKNQDLIAKHNFDNEAKVESSPGSLYNIGILKKQYDEALEDLEKLRAEQKKISDAISAPDDDASKAQIERLENMIQDLKSYSRVAGAIFWEYKNSMLISAWIPTSIDLYIQNFQI